MVSKSKTTTAKRKTTAKSKTTSVKALTVGKAAPKKKITSKKEAPPTKKVVASKTTSKTTTKATVKKTTTTKKKTTTKKQISKKATTAPTKVTIKQPMTKDTQDNDIAILEERVEKNVASSAIKQAPKKAAPVTSAATLAAKEIIASTKTRNLSNELPDIDPDSNKNLPASSQGFMGIAPYAISPNEEYMNEKQRQHFKNILLAWRLSLMEEVDRIVNHMQDESANFPDPTDRATQEEEFSLALRARDRERKLIRKINEALERIKHDEYGFCDTCGVDIGIRRLEARPTATLCIDCKTLDEIRERQMKQ
jgi:DnaK suppressor protein